jgi:NTE family protein
VLDQPLERDLLVFAVDLFSAHGPMPRNLGEVAEREKDIRYSSRMRMDTDLARRLHHGVTLVQLIHRLKQDDRATKDFEFAQGSLAAHWRMGREDMDHTLRSAAWRDRAAPRGGVRVIDAAHRLRSPTR